MSKAIMVLPPRDQAGPRIWAPTQANGGAVLVNPSEMPGHIAATDPHPGYATDADLTAHTGAVDPHTGYQRESEKAAASGYASLDATTKVPIAQLPTGTAGTQVSLGNHAHTAAYEPAGAVADHEAELDPHPDYVDAAELGTQFSTHSSQPDPHAVYQKESEKGVLNGYASLDANTRVPLAQLGAGSPNATTYLRGDGSWQTPAAGGGGPSPGSATTGSGVGDATSHGASTDYSRTDHRHGREVFGSVTPGTTFGTASGDGVSTAVSRSDHAHGTPTNPVAYATPVANGPLMTPGAGTQNTVARSDHNHGALFPKQDDNTQGGEITLQGAGTYPNVQLDNSTGAFRALVNGVPAVYVDAVKLAGSVQAFGDTPVGGTSPRVSFSDHKHGMPVNPVTAHEAAADPHTAYQRESEKGAASGYASLDAATHVPAAELGSGVPDSTTFLRGDGSWQAVSATGLAGSGTTASGVGDATAHGAAIEYSRTDHRHGREAFGAVTAQTSFGLGSGNGSAATPSRSDHVHGTPANPVVYGAVTPQTSFGLASNSGASANLSRADHVHGTPATPADPMPAHLVAADPHTGYQLESGREVINGYPGLDGYGYLAEPWRKAAAYPTTRNDADNTTRYAKIASGSMATNGTSGAAMSILCADFQTGQAKRVDARFAVVRTAVGTDPQVMLDLVNPQGFSANDLMVVITSNGEPTTYEVYLALTSQWELGWISPLNAIAHFSNQLTAMAVVWHELAPLVTALPTGTVVKALPLAQNGWFNVKDFGAKGDGIADDTAAIQSAIDTAVATKVKNVWFPPGTYGLTATLRVKNTITLRGAGRGGRPGTTHNWEAITEFKWLGATGPLDGMLYIGPDLGGICVTGARVDDISFHGNNIANCAIHLKGTTDGHMWVAVHHFAANGKIIWCNAWNHDPPETLGYTGNHSWDMNVISGHHNRSPIMWLDGAPNRYNNTCGNWIRCVGFYGYWDGGPGVEPDPAAAHMIVIMNGDHNYIDYVWGFPQWGTSKAYVMFFGAGQGTTAPAGGARKNWARMAAGGCEGEIMLYFQGSNGGVNKPALENAFQTVDLQSSQTVFVGGGAESNRWFGDMSFYYAEEGLATPLGSLVHNYTSGSTVLAAQNWTTTVWPLTSTADSTITGWMPPPNGSMRWIYNANAEGSGKDITLAHANTGSDANNRFICPNNANVVLQPGEMISMWYSETLNRWSVFGKS